MFRKGPKRASKVQESKLIKNAQKLSEDPMKVIPECVDDCFFCKFKKSEKYIKKIAHNKDDKAYLEKMSRKGTDLSKAVAGTLLLTLEKSAPLLKSAKTSRGDVSYARKGNAGEKYLLGVQYFNDPVIRLLAYYGYSKKGFYFYSWKDNIVCAGKNGEPPKEYVDQRISRVPYNLERGGDVSSCGHKDPYPYIVLNWKGAKEQFLLCSRCARKDVNLFVHLTEGMLSDDNSRAFSLKGHYRLECKADCKDCSIPKGENIPGELREKYLAGNISDSELLKDYSMYKRKRLKASPKAYVIGTKCYGLDTDKFLQNFDHEDWELEALKKGIDGKPIVVDQDSVNELLSSVWESRGEEILGTYIRDKDKIEELYERGKNSTVTPRDVLREAHNIQLKEDRLKALPSFKVLPVEGEMAHGLALIYKTQGVEETINHINNMDTSNTRLKALAYGFLEAFDSGDTHRWRYDRTEIDSGKFMKPYVVKVLESEGDEYGEALQELVKMSGSTAKIILEDGTELR